MTFDQGYWLRFLVCFLLISSAICASLPPSEYVRLLVQAARQQEEDFSEFQPAFYRVSRNELSRNINGPADLPMLRFG